MRVTLKCEQVVQYNQSVEMSEEDYNILKDYDGADMFEEDANRAILEKYLDFGDVFYGEPEYSNVDVSKQK